ncbi:MAG: ATP-binding protein [Rhodanobacter sp.]
MQPLIDALADRDGRAQAADALARALGAEALLILVSDSETGAVVPAFGFPRTLPGGPSWHAFLAACERPGDYLMDVDYPDRLSRKAVRAHVSEDGSVTALIGGTPRYTAAALSQQLLPVIRLLRSEREVIAARGDAAAAGLANRQASVFAATVDQARRRSAEQASQLQAALGEAARLNAELTELTLTLEQRIEAGLAERKLLAELVENAEALVLVADLEYRVLAINRAAANEFERVHGRRPRVGMSLVDLLADVDERHAAVKAMWDRALAGEAFTATEVVDDPVSERHYEIKFNVLRNKDGQRIGAYQFAYNVTDRLLAQARSAKAEEALRQSQKMEAVGQLTGGIAHDFNNLLTVILGGLEQLDRGLSAIPDLTLASRMRRFRDMAIQASLRAATLTSRLLAFSRRQPLDPKPVDANRLITGVADMLTRTLGEQVQLEVVRAPALWMTQVDVSELESALLNLAVNARDAMPEGGRLTIETQNAILDDDYVSTNAEPITAGEYVLVSVTDTGIGMNEETLERVFEPFFTTKPVGQGTGLGLSQIYGFIGQSNGHVRISSVVGQGTTIKLYLPRVTEPAEESGDAPARPARSGGHETILVVEDHDDLRTYSVGVLRELGYRVLDAATGPAALAVLADAGRVDMLFTDVVLPEKMDGRRLADLARVERPCLKVLFTSGYARDAIIHNGRLDSGVHLLPKPFTSDALASKVRQVLDEPEKGAGSSGGNQDGGR